MSNNVKETNILRRCALVCAALLIITSLILLIFGDLNSPRSAIKQLKQGDAAFNRLQLPDDLGGALVVTLIDAETDDLWMVTTEERSSGEYSYVYVLNLSDGITQAYRYLGSNEQLETATYRTPVKYKFSPFTFTGRFIIENEGTTATWTDESTEAHVTALAQLAEQNMGQYVTHGGAVALLILMALELFALISFIGASKMNEKM
jgi:hypothetical protein